MPEIADPPKKPFSAGLIAALPSGKQTTAPPEPTKPTSAAAPPAPSAVKPALSSAPPTDSDAEILEGKRAPKGEDFKRVKHAAAEANKRADELKAKHEAAEKRLAELDKAPKHNAELIKKIEAERDEFKAKWQTVEAQFDPGFHAKYDAQVSEAIVKIKDIVPADRLNDLAQVLQMPEGERKRKILAELEEDLDIGTVTEIRATNREVRDILAARKRELETSDTILKTGAEKRQKEQAERKTAYAKSFDDVLAAKSAGDDAIPVLQTREGDTPEVKAWNAGVAERSKVARAMFMDEYETPEEKAEASIWAASAPGFLAELMAAQSELATLKETLSKVQGTSPGIGAGGKGDGGGKKLSFTERMMQTTQ